jgi:hypothetical protein
MFSPPSAHFLAIMCVGLYCGLQVAEELRSASGAERVELYHHYEIGTEEQEQARSVARAFLERGYGVHEYMSATMYHPNDLPVGFVDPGQAPPNHAKRKRKAERRKRMQQQRQQQQRQQQQPQPPQPQQQPPQPQQAQAQQKAQPEQQQKEADQQGEHLAETEPPKPEPPLSPEPEVEDASSIGGQLRTTLVNLPAVMSVFRRTVGSCTIRSPLPPPPSPFPPCCPPPPFDIDAGELPTVPELCGGAEGLAAIRRLLRGHYADAAGAHVGADVEGGTSNDASDPACMWRNDTRSAFPFHGGELHGQARVLSFLGLRPTVEQPGPSQTAASASATSQASSSVAGTPPQQQPPPQSSPMPPPPVARPALHFRERRSLASRGAEGVDDSAKFSPWLALGALSPRWVHAQLERFRAGASGLWLPPTPPLGAEGVADADASAAASQTRAVDWLQMHLTIRDFFLFTGVKAGAALFRSDGIRGAASRAQYHGSPGAIIQAPVQWCVRVCVVACAVPPAV